MNMILRTLCATTALAGASASFAQVVAAAASVDSGLDDIIVTASKTGASKLQDTPLAVTAFNADTLERTGIKDVRDLASLTPNLQVTQNSSFSQVYIRGIGSNNVFAGSDPSSTIHLDGVYLARPASYLANFLDVERIEVLRGPQGTLYGRNSVGGTINVISRKPTDDLTARAQLSYGNYGFVRGEAYVSGRIVADKVAASLSMIRSKRDGYLKNVAPGVGDADSENSFGARGQVRITPSTPLEIIVRADYVHSDDSVGSYIKLLQATADPLSNSVLGDFHKIAANIRPWANRRQWGTAAEINYDLSDSLQFKSLTAYRESRLVQVGDTDATALNIRRTDQFENQHQLSQEFNLTGHAGGLTYIGGLYYFKEHIDVSSTVTTFPTLAVNYSPTVSTEALAAFGQVTYAFTDTLSVTGGLRYTREHKTFDQFAVNRSLITGLPLATYPRAYDTGAV